MIRGFASKCIAIFICGMLIISSMLPAQVQASNITVSENQQEDFAVSGNTDETQPELSVSENIGGFVEPIEMEVPAEPVTILTVSENTVRGIPVSEAGEYRIYSIRAEWNEEKMADVSGGDAFTPDMVELTPVLYWYDGDGNQDKDNDRHPVTYGSPLTEEEYRYEPTVFVAGEDTYISCTYIGSSTREPLAEGTLLSEDGSFGFEYWVEGKYIVKKTLIGLECEQEEAITRYVGTTLTCSDFRINAFYDVTYNDGTSPADYLERIYDFTITPSIVEAGLNEIEITYTENGTTVGLYEPVYVNGIERTVTGSLENAKAGTIKKQLYTGYPICPAPKVTLKGKTLTENVDYVLTYENNVEEGTATVTASGIGNYEGSLSKTFRIYKNDIKKATVKSIPKQLYSGEAITPELSVKYSGKALTEGKDYEASFASNTEEGTAYVTITGLGSYKGSKQVKFSIYKVKMSACKIAGVATMAYTGSTVTLPLVVTYQGAALTDGTDYSVAYANNDRAGKASVTITGLGSYKGTVTKNFTIKDYSPENWKLNLSASSFLYTGEAVEPKVTVTCKGGTLTYGTHYTVKYENNVNEGTAKASVLDMGGNVVLEKPFTIYKADLSKASVKGLSKQQYTGEAITPAFTVTYKGNILTEGLHYAVTYSNNTEVGKATVILSAEKGGTGSKKANFSIYKVTMASVKADSIYDYPYTGKAVIPSLRLTYKGIPLSEGTDYSVTFVNNIKPGKATAVITGQKGFTGTKKLKFTITKPSVAGLTVTGVEASYQRVGACTVNEYKELALKGVKSFEIRPEVTVTNAGNLLKEGTDYAVDYKNNRNAGTASVVVKGTGVYSGTRTVYFAITGGKTGLEKLIEDVYGETVNWKSEDSIAKLMEFLKDYGVEGMDDIYTGDGTPVISAKNFSMVLIDKTYDRRTPLNWSMQKEKILNPARYFGWDKLKYEIYYDGKLLIKDVDYTAEINIYVATTDKWNIEITGIGKYGGSKKFNLHDMGLTHTDSTKDEKGNNFFSYVMELGFAYGNFITYETNETYGTNWLNPPRWFYEKNLHLDDWYDHMVSGMAGWKADGSHNYPPEEGEYE